ncbi:MAG: hypothetical protein LBL63_06460, partial [Clostridiales Family XIII bacterium]|nr:hypothetical protein [Clostridiales Family XIII bacterium]
YKIIKNKPTFEEITDPLSGFPFISLFLQKSLKNFQFYVSNAPGREGELRCESRTSRSGNFRERRFERFGRTSRRPR